MKKLNILAIALLLMSRNGFSQGFINLNFEEATIVLDHSSSYYPYAVYTSDAIPGWATSGSFLGTNDIAYNALSLGSPSVGIFGTNGNPAALAGNYSIDLYNGVSISQTGVVPANASSLDFIAVGADTSLLILSLGGQDISFVPISGGPNYTEYGGNLPSGMDGLSEPLVFSALAGENNYWEIDDIQFSPTTVPEPGTFGLLGLGGAFFAWRYRHKFFKTEA